MKSKSKKMSPTTASVLVGLVAAAVLAGGVFLVVLPQRSQAAELDREVVALNAEIETKRAESLRKPQAPIRVADLFKLVQAMPDNPDMPGILLELNQTARDSGITFDSIAPQAPVSAGDRVIFPIAVEFTGSFYRLTDLVYRLRNLVAVRRGKLDARGRLFSIDSVDFSQAADGFPSVSAKLTVNAFVYGTNVPGAAQAAPVPTPTETTTTGSDSESEPTPPSDGATALGSE